MVVVGYKLAGTTDISDIDMRLIKIRHGIKKRATKIYHCLLGDEMAFFVDTAALNIATPNGSCTLFQCALDELNARIQRAGLLGEASQYNFNVYVQVMTYKDDTYFKVLCQNKEYLKAFKDLEPYHLSEEECKDAHNKKAIVWTELHKLYEKNEPLSVNLTPSPALDVTKLVFPSKDERAQTQARHSVTNRYLNQIGGGQQIPPFKMMRYLDVALAMVLSETGAKALSEASMQLAQILPDISIEDEKMFGSYCIKKDDAEKDSICTKNEKKDAEKTGSQKAKKGAEETEKAAEKASDKTEGPGASAKKTSGKRSKTAKEPPVTDEALAKADSEEEHHE